ncbi:MAG TPA: hypothetical protein DHV28_07055 [Ignavibacteriales bacterium]|nr:hypothetical protein [Ignavibacteriales bacterium]
MNSNGIHISLFTLILVFLFTLPVYTQTADLKQIPLKYKDVKESASVAINDNELLFFFVNPTQDSIYSIRTTDLGSNWSQQSLILKFESNQSAIVLRIAAIKTNTNRIILSCAYSSTTIISDSIIIIKSDDLGHSWSSPSKIKGGNLANRLSNKIGELVLTKSSSNTLYLSFNNRANHYLWFKKSIDDGQTWTDTAKTIYFSNYFTISDVNIFTLDDQNLNTIFVESTPGQNVLMKKSSDAGETWSDTETIFGSEEKIKFPRTIITDDNRLWLVYQKELFYNLPYSSGGYTAYYFNNNIYYRISTDLGNTWGEEIQLTKYTGDDNYLNLTYYNNVPLISFSTQRFSNNYNLTFLIPNKIDELKTPPYIGFSYIESIDSLKTKFSFKAYVFDDEAMKKVTVNLDNGFFNGELYDDGNHDDGEANDSLYGVNFEISRLNNYESYLIQSNNLKIPINKKGIIASLGYPHSTNYLSGILDCYDIHNSLVTTNENYPVPIIDSYGGKFDGEVFLFASGFLMSGLDGDSIWANGVATASLIEDYLPGNVGSDPEDKRNSIYVLKVDDKPFGNSWQIWKDAVNRGAEFYDGDNDGIYNPVDKNFNGIWDTDEDMPMILGDETVWCVFNDGVPAYMRRLGVPPKNIEVAQTIFTSIKPGLENVMFLRYKILNKSNVDYDSVYFGFWADTDLGQATDDRVGCDTMLNSGMVYNNGSDYYYGDNPPAFFTTLLQGPITETGLNADTAFNRLGELLGTKIFSGSLNSKISAHTMSIGGDPSLSDPSESIFVRNYLMGKTHFGDYPDPCTFSYGHVLGGINCDEVNKRLWFSGDPVNQVGWVETLSSDVRNLLSTGPFTLKQNEPIDIIAAYIVGRGTDALNSITVTREIVAGVIQEYQNNFPRLTYKSGLPTNPIISYELYQNYPNPFNPVTTIRYALPQDGVVTIKVFDILGQQVATLKNEYQKANRYEVQFNSKGLASGVYIYKLQVNDYSESKKMMLLK